MDLLFWNIRFRLTRRNVCMVADPLFFLLYVFLVKSSYHLKDKFLMDCFCVILGVAAALSFLGMSLGKDDFAIPMVATLIAIGTASFCLSLFFRTLLLWPPSTDRIAAIMNGTELCANDTLLSEYYMTALYADFLSSTFLVVLVILLLKTHCQRTSSPAVHVIIPGDVE